MIFVFFLFISNFLILLGPMLLMGITQIRGYEPGDADWGVKLDDVRGQAEAKEEVRRVVSLWQSGEAFEQAGGKRERGLLFLGAPGTGKTMLSKAIATGFNWPFVSIPGSGFAQTFIGMDAIIVRYLARKAKRLARKWGGQCIVFIDEIDAVGMRRQALEPAAWASRARPRSCHPTTPCFYGPWRRAHPDRRPRPRDAGVARAAVRRARDPRGRAERALRALLGVQNFMFPGHGRHGRRPARAQPAARRDGRHRQPAVHAPRSHEPLNTFLDAIYIVPRRVGKISLRLPPPRPRKEQIYFIGARNVPLERLDPALTRPGRMGRHIWFRTPTKEDRHDIFDLYLGKVAHDARARHARAPRRARAHHRTATRRR